MIDIETQLKNKFYKTNRKYSLAVIDHNLIRYYKKIQRNKNMTIKITSTAFNEGESIPDKYGCLGVNISPPLTWKSVAGTKTYAIICDDPDAPGGTWTHWVMHNIPSDVTALPEWVMEREELENGARQGFNDFGTIGYRGPCPPQGTHRYYYKVYALDIEIPLKSRTTKKELLDAMDGHILDEGNIMGRYKR